MKPLNKRLAWYLDYRSTQEITSVFINQHSFYKSKNIEMSDLDPLPFFLGVG